MLLNGAVYSVVHLMIEWDFKYILPQVLSLPIQSIIECTVLL